MLNTQEARSGDPAIRRSGDPAIRRSGDPAIRRSGDPAIRHYTKGSSLSPCQPLRETIFRAPGNGRKRCAQRADRMSSFVEDGHRDLSEPVARLAGAHSCRASPVPSSVPYAEPGGKAIARSRLHNTTRGDARSPVSAATEPPTAAPISCMTMQAAAPPPSTEIPAESVRPLSPYRAPSLSASAVVVARRLAAHASRSDLRYRTRLPKR